MVYRVVAAFFILAISITSWWLYVETVIEGVRLVRQRRNVLWHDPRTVRAHVAKAILAVLAMFVTVLIVLLAVAYFHLPLTWFYYHVHRWLVDGFLVFLPATFLFNGKWFPRIHRYMGPSTAVLYTLLTISGCYLALSLLIA
jgi:hypothetical protein